jgi:serine/threonine protein kinase
MMKQTDDKSWESAAANNSGLLGKTLEGKYRIEEHLGSGGMCDVYRATHMLMGKQVAIKILKPHLAADPALAQRFEQEARAASRIHHPNAINVMDYGIGEDNMPFIVMEYVNGITLGELIRQQGGMTLERAANILRQIAGALDDAHAVGVIHRDIKPDNIIIADYGNSDWVEVVDFGVAKVQEDLNRRASLTGANVLVGTPRYMSPEQCEERPVDARSDIYSLGVVLYEMLAGEAPFKGDSSTRLLVAHTTEPPEPLRLKRPDIPATVEAVVMRALEKDPGRRPQSAGEFATEFATAAGLGQPVRSGQQRGAFSRIHVPVGVESVDDVDEATLVRPRPAALNRMDTPVDGRVNTPINAAAATQTLQDDYRLPGKPYVVETRSSGNKGLVTAIIIAGVILAGVAAYLAFGKQWFGPTTTRESVIDAQQSVTTAIALVDSLPKDHPLKTYLTSLRQWQGELKAYQEVTGSNQQVSDRADGYRSKADDISGQARVALAALGREVPANINTPVATTQPSSGNRSAINTAPTNANREAASTDDSASDTASATDEPRKPADDQEGRSANANRPRRADPPSVQPVDTDDAKPQNSNTRKHSAPPKVDPVNANEGAPDSMP